METINIHQAKTHLSRLIARVTAGEEIVITKAGKPVARLVPVAVAAPRTPGLLKGRIKIAKDFDAPLPDEIIAAFEGRGRRR